MKKTTLWMTLFLVLVPISAMGQGAAWSTDINCDGNTNVVDVIMLISQALGEPMSDVIDGNGNTIPDACEGMSMGMVCGAGTEPNETGDVCVVSAAFLEQVFADGVASVDITADNQAVADVAYADGFASGVESVDCDAPLCEGMESVIAYFDTPEGNETNVSGGCNAGCFGYATSAGTSWAYLCDGEATACPSIFDDCSGSCETGILCEEPVPQCGNGVTEPGETCDDENTMSGDGCSSDCQEETTPPDTGGQVVSGSRRIFVTSVDYNGNMGGLSGADANCQQRAEIAGLGGNWKAWLSDSNEDAKDRLSHPDGNLLRVDGVIVANNWDSLVSGSPWNAPEIDEFGQQKPYVGNGGTGGCSWSGGYFFHPWTATSNGGSLDGGTCSDWTTTSGTGRVGLGGYSLSQWSTWCDFPCNWNQPLYCFEQ